jgi:hypothetical protein
MRIDKTRRQHYAIILYAFREERIQSISGNTDTHTSWAVGIITFATKPSLYTSIL